MSWTAIVVMTAGAYGFKFFGVFVLARISDRSAAAFQSLIALVPAALFAALVAVQTLEAGGGLQIDARAAGVAAGALAVLRRMPFVLVVLVAMTVSAAIRWQTLG